MSQHSRNANFCGVLSAARIVPVLTIEDAARAVPLADAIAAGGLSVIEITLRNHAALDAIQAVARGCPGVTVGAGTVRSPEQAEAAIEAGARFLVSPGVTPRLVSAAEHWPVPFLPGVATASEAMALADLGYRALKFFPAESAGGAKALGALAAPLSELVFCPTGGVTPVNVSDYFAQPNVIAVGGSWLAPRAAVERHDWESVSEIVRTATAL